MSSPIHPDWQNTDAETEEVPVHDVNAPAPTEMHTISRRPAAIAGILLVVGSASLFMHGVDTLTGQLTEPISVILADTGIDPVEITVPAGEEVRWTNQQEIPQYLISDTLCSPSADECMSTSTMFEGDEISYTIPADVPAGSYEYFSPTDPSLTGTIIVTKGSSKTVTPAKNGDTPAAGTTEPSPVDSVASALTSAQQRLLDSIQKQLQIEKDTNKTKTIHRNTDTSIPTANAPINGIAQNPYTIGGIANVPIANAGNGQGFVPPTQERPQTFGNNQIQKPYRQADTGAEVWAVLVLAIAGLWLVTRGYFVGYTE
ncbi:MAG: hypothetical protein O2904_00255 [bacterium]|nr:hypothetical protein [bacterium]